MQFDKINNGPFAGVEAPPTSIGIDTSVPQLYIAGNANQYVAVPAVAAAAVLIAKQTATSGTSISFASIPQTFTHLRLVGTFAITSGANLALQFNGDTTTAHYAYGLNLEDNGTPTAAASNSTTQILIGGAAGSVDITIQNYAASAGGTFLTGNFAAAIIGSLTEMGSGGGLWTGNGVTSILLKDSGGTASFASAEFSLYGLS